jgi:TolB-like protein/predicted Ser/Thr protein kinase
MAGPTALQDSLIGLEFGHYRILERIGSGGMGVVYRGYDAHLEREVAIKVLNPGTIADEHSRKRFRNEAHALSKLNHPNIATVYDFETFEGRDFLVMEFIPGMTLKEKLAQGSFPEKDVTTLGMQLAEGLSAAHEHGVVHRDLKPGNLLLNGEGRLKILDFGLAKLRLATQDSPPSETLSETHAIAGTLPYMAPEQVLGGAVDARTDIHAAGIILYEMATGLRAFAAADRSDLICAILRSSPTPVSTHNPKLSAELARIIGKCLEREPENRYQSAKELAIDLHRLHLGTLSDLHSTSMVTHRQSAERVRWTMLALASVLVLIVALTIANRYGFLFGGANAGSIQSLAVLPLANLSGDPQQEYFADGMTEELITNLGKVRALRVISRTSVLQYKQTQKTVPTIAQELNVDAIVEGSVLRSGNRVRITAQLIQAKAERQLWSETYERDVSDVLALQSDVAQAITSEVKTKVTPQEQTRLANRRPVDPEAFETTVKGKHVFEYATREQEFQQAVELFQRAINRDPTYAPAWAGLADALWTQAGTGIEIVSPEDVRDRAIAAAQKALELDETLPDAHDARANIAVEGEWDFAKGQLHYEKALELEPGYAAAHNDYAEMLTAPLQQFSQARQHLDRARELDPLSPWNDINLLVWWRFQGRPEKVVEEGERARRRNATIWIIPWEIGLARLDLGQASQAANEFEAALKVASPDRPASVLAALGMAYGLAGRKDDALQILAELKLASQNRYVSPFYPAIVYSGLGRMNEAFPLLDRALEQRSPPLLYFTRYDSLCVALRRDLRWKPFIDLLKSQVRLPAGIQDPYS